MAEPKIRLVPCLRDDPVRFLDLGPIELSVRPGFLKGHLLPRMSRQIGDVNTIHSLETQRGWFENSGMHNWVSDEVEYRALRATRKAAKDYLYEATRIGSWLESRAVSVGGHGSNAVRSTKFRFDVSHGIPKVGLRHRAAVGATRFDVALDGSVRLEFRPAQLATARFYVGYVAATVRLPVVLPRRLLISFLLNRCRRASHGILGRCRSPRSSSLSCWARSPARSSSADWPGRMCT